MTMRYHVLVYRRAVCAVVTALLSGVILTGCTIGDETSADLDAARNFNAYPLYWVGERFEGLDLSYVGLGGQAVGFVYGTCEARGDQGCAPPLQIQVFPLCSHLDIVAANQIWTRRKIRGAPVGVFDAAPVMFTRRAQVKVYRGEGSDPGMALRALHALRSLNDVSPEIGPVGSIPPPAPGVLEGTTPCPG